MLSWNSCLVKAWEYNLGVNIRKQIAEIKKFNEKEGRNVFKFIIRICKFPYPQACGTIRIEQLFMGGDHH